MQTPAGVHSGIPASWSWVPYTLTLCLFAYDTSDGHRQARNQLGTPGGAKSFLRGAQIFWTMPTVLNHVQHIFPGGENI